MMEAVPSMGLSPTHHQDLQNNNVTDISNHMTAPGPFVNTSQEDGVVDNHEDPATSSSNKNPSFKIGSSVTRVNSNLDQGLNSGPSSLWGEEGGPSSITDEYLDDPLPELILEGYSDPSIGYVFVNDTWNSRLDNSDALLNQLQALGVRVNHDYLNLDLDLDLSFSRSASLSTGSDTASLEDDPSIGLSGGPKNSIFHNQTKNVSNKEIIEGEDVFSCSSQPVSGVYENAFEDEVAEAEILPNGDVVVTYDNYKKHYRPRLNNQNSYIDYLELVHKDDSPTSLDAINPSSSVPSSENGTSVNSHESTIEKTPTKLSRSMRLKRRILARRLITPLPLQQLANLPSKYAQKFRKFIAEEVSFDAVTPDSGVHENFVNLSVEDQEKQRNEWEQELAKTEDEIQTLRQVLAARVKHAQDLKRRLGVTIWKEFSDDFSTSFKSVKESQPVQKANEVIAGIGEAVYAAPLYQKTAGAVGAVGEKTTSLFGGITAKFGQLKETPTFKSFEERIGSTVTAAKSKMGGSGSNSTQDFQEVIQESDAENAQANGGATLDQTIPQNQLQMDPNQQQQPTS